MSTIKLTKDEASDIIENANIEIDAGGWRWGTVKGYVFAQDEKYYRMDVRFHCEEGPQLDYGIDAYEVKPVERTVTDWVKVQDGS